MEYRVELYAGARSDLRPLFELADDSAQELDRYMDAGRVLVAVAGDAVIGHVQLTDAARPREVEIKNMAVLPRWQGSGVGRALVAQAVTLARTERRSALIVATATADVGNLRFYQRQGFRMRSIERDAFTAANGYRGVVIDGIELRDRVWLDRRVDP